MHIQLQAESNMEQVRFWKPLNEASVVSVFSLYLKEDCSTSAGSRLKNIDSKPAGRRWRSKVGIVRGTKQVK